MEYESYLKSGTLLHNNSYRIERVLGQGGFGITYLATHTLLNKYVAIKEFFPKSYCNRDATTSKVTTPTSSNVTLVERLKVKFVKEAEHIGKFDSPNIVKIIDVFEENSTAYYIMDYIEGISLNDLVKQHGPLSEEKAIEYVLKIGKALTYIHSKHVNHLDVKPANIMLRLKDDNPILVDFGLSKQYDSDGNQTSTTPVGISHGYAPMEQYRDGGVKEFSPQTDLYSLAATLYYLLTGIVPPQAVQMIDEELSFPAGFPDRLIPIIAQAMSTKRTDRQPDIDIFCNQLVDPAQFSVQRTLTESREETQLSDTIIKEHQKVAPAKDSVKSKASVDSKERKPLGVVDQPKNKNKAIKIIAIGIPLIIIVSLVFTYIFNGNDGNRGGADPYEDEPMAYAMPEADSFAADCDAVDETVAATSSNVIHGHEYVDLGLPSGLKWATCNVGAYSPEEYGDYFAWGETSTKSTYSKSNSKTYNIEMHDISGNVNYDAARAKWGSSWRMPTYDEMCELVNKCKWNWTSQNGVKGIKVTGPNGNYIFLPAAGSKIDSDKSAIGKCGYYWTSTPDDMGEDYACSTTFTDGDIYDSLDNRYMGSSIRPVSD